MNDHILPYAVDLFLIRQRAARRDGIVFVALLVVAVLGAGLLSSQLDYRPSTSVLSIMVFLWLILTINAAGKLAEYRMLKNTLELLKAIRQTMGHLT